MRLFLHRGRFAGRSKYSTWVHGVAVRTCLSIRRGRGRRRRHESVAPDAQWESQQPAPKATPPGLAMDLLKMLEMLDEEDRAMLHLEIRRRLRLRRVGRNFRAFDQRLQDAA